MMKKGFLFLAIATVFVACTEKKVTPDYVIFSGKIENTTDKEFNLEGIYANQKITLNNDGTFLDTLYIDYNGVYFAENQLIYLHKGKNLTMNIDFKDTSKATFSGDLAVENTYFVERVAIINGIIGKNVREFYTFEEQEYLQKVNEIAQKVTELTENASFSVTDFKKSALRDVDYIKKYYLSIYENNHRIVTQNNQFEVSENFPKEEVEDYDNAEDFNFSSAYRNFVTNNFEEEVEDEFPEEEPSTKDYVNAIQKHLDEYKSENIKNYLAAYSLSNLMSPGSEDLDFVYNQTMTTVKNEKTQAEVTRKYNQMKELTKGKPSPKFEFENYKGGKTSLDDLKGKFVYIDVWATWCGPCVRELPFLQSVEKQYHGKNIEFVSISVDNKKDYEKWKSFVETKGLGGIQLFADKAWESDFVQEYAINGIPRFILIDTEGNIVRADAPRPSEEALIELFSELGI